MTEESNEKRCDLSEEDRQLIDRLLRNERAAWVEVFVPMAEMLMRQHDCVSRLERNGHSPCEVISELYLMFQEDDCALLRTVTSSFIGWLYGYVRTAVNTVLDGKHRVGGGKKTCKTHEVLLGARSDEDGEESAEAALERAALKRYAEADDGGKIVAALEAPDEMRVQKRREAALREAFPQFWLENPRAAYALVCYYQMGMKYEDIGAVLGEKYNTVQAWVYRGMAWWTQALAEIK